MNCERCGEPIETTDYTAMKTKGPSGPRDKDSIPIQGSSFEWNTIFLCYSCTARFWVFVDGGKLRLQKEAEASS